MRIRLLTTLFVLALLPAIGYAQKDNKDYPPNLGADSLILAIHRSDDKDANKVFEEALSKYYKGKFAFINNNDTLDVNSRYLVIMPSYMGDRKNKKPSTTGYSFWLVDLETEKKYHLADGFSKEEKFFEKLAMDLEKMRAATN